MIAYETQTFFYSLLIGFCLGPVYDIFRILRIAGIRQKLHVALQDVLFLVFFLTATFLFFIKFTNGLFRTYVIASEVLGFLFYYFTIGSLVIKGASKIVSAIQKATAFFKRKIIVPICNIVGKTIYKIKSKFILFSQKFKKNQKNKKLHLQARHHLLYNISNSIQLFLGGAHKGENKKK